MNPILVPTLAELRIELDRANAVRLAVPRGHEAAYEAALTCCWAIIDEIAELPASCLADLRVKAYAVDWSARVLEDEPFGNPSEGERKMFQQLVAGLLDERLG